MEANGWCDVVIDGIGKVAEYIHIDEGTNKGSFFYPFVQAGKEYTVHFSFKRNETKDSEGFVNYATADNTIKTSTETVTAGPHAKGEVRLQNKPWIVLSSDYYIIYFEKPEFENEELLGDDWQTEIGLMEGISWDHDEERRTKWHCQVAIPNNYESCNLRDLKPLYGCDDHDNHEIDCVCVRPIMSYEYNGKQYNYMWDGYTADVYYPPKSWKPYFEEIDANNYAQVQKISGTWKFEPDWWQHSSVVDDALYHIVETLEIDLDFLTITTNYEIRNLFNDRPFTDTEEQWILHEQEKPFGHLFIDYADWDSYTSDISEDNKKLYKKYVCQPISLNKYLENDKYYYYKLGLYKEILRINKYDKSDNQLVTYYDYYKQ